MRKSAHWEPKGLQNIIKVELKINQSVKTSCDNFEGLIVLIRFVIYLPEKK